MSHPAERAPIPMVQATADGVITWANSAAAPLLQAWDTGVGMELPPAEADRVGLIASTRIDAELDLQLAGAPWTFRFVPDPTGREVLIVALERRAKAEAERRLLVADRAPALHPDPILRVDRQARLTWNNQVAAGITRHWRIDVGDPLPADWAAAVARVLREERAHAQTLQIKSTVWTLRLVPDVDQAAVYLFAAETERPSSAAPEATRDNFVANMGHELRTPLNAIHGYSELVQDELRSAGMADAVADLDKVKEAAARLRALIDGVVDLARLQAGRIPLSPRSFFLADLVDDVVMQCAPAAELQRNQVLVDIQVDPPEVVADPDRLRQILGALVDNACKFTEDGTVQVDATDVPGHVQIHVRDTGIGLSAVQLAGLFRPYRQGDGSSTRKAGGTGLGLAIARMLARRMGGDIDVRSEPGKGSTFTLSLPREPAL